MPHNPDPAAAAVGRRPWTLLVLLCVAQFMVILDVTVTNVALPSIGRDLGFAAADLQWVVTAYVLFTGGLLLLGGRAADRLGRRNVFLAGLGVFTLASLASGLAWSPLALVASRAAQGLGAAMLSPAALSIITTTYAGEQRAKALAVWGAIGGAGAAVGVVLGGVLTTVLGWESVFFINVPIGLAALALASRLVPASGPAGARALDPAGAATLVGGLVSLVYAVEGAPDHGWGSARTLGFLALATSLLAAFAVIERRVGAPLVPPRTWRVRSLVSSATVMLGATGLLISTFFLNSLYLQRALDASALETGLAFLPLSLVTAVGVHGGPHLDAHVGTRGVAALGVTLMGAGALLFSAAPDHVSYVADLLPGLLLVGLGVGLVFVTVSVTAMAHVTHEDAGLASGLMMTAHEIGAALGVAVLSAVAAGAPTLADGYRDGFLVAAVIAAILVVVALRALPGGRIVGAPRAAMH